jgi:predicted transcriptional regulator
MNNIQLLELKQMIRTKPESEPRKPDKHTRKLLLYLFTGSRGGHTRLKIIELLLQRPYNTHQLAQVLGFDYKAIQHHMKVLENNNLVNRVGEKYGSIFHISNFLEYNIRALDEAIEILERKANTKKVYY